jgi:hypothetical protein
MPAGLTPRRFPPPWTVNEGVFHFEQTRLDNARQISRLNRVVRVGDHDSAEE